MQGAAPVPAMNFHFRLASLLQGRLFIYGDVSIKERIEPGDLTQAILSQFQWREFLVAEQFCGFCDGGEQSLYLSSDSIQPSASLIAKAYNLNFLAFEIGGKTCETNFLDLSAVFVPRFANFFQPQVDGNAQFNLELL